MQNEWDEHAHSDEIGSGGFMFGTRNLKWISTTFFPIMVVDTHITSNVRKMEKMV
jgi:hypothetical protein